MQVSIQEFKSHLSQYIERAQWAVIELTSHRKVVARIIGIPQSDHAGVARLLAAGVATWQGGGGKPTGASLKLQDSGKLVSQMVLEDRA
jgi:antitoxin (DNA-binding transcriptional repressor) of toxin-antitoxin stability system